MLPFSCILAKKRAAQNMEFFFHEADGLSCTKQVPLVVDFRAAAEGAVRARRQLVQVVSAPSCRFTSPAAGKCSLPYGGTSTCSRKTARTLLTLLCYTLVRAVHESAMRPRC